MADTRLLMPVLTIAVILWLRMKKMISRKLFLLFLVLTLASSVLLVTEILRGDRTEIDSIERSNLAQDLELDTGEGDVRKIEITAARADISEEEAKPLLEEQCAGLEEEILGKNESLHHVEWNLDLATSYENEIKADWTSDHPEYISWDGTLMNGIPESGVRVRLTVELMLGEYTENKNIDIVVYPSNETESIQAELQAEADAENTGNAADTYQLPEQLRGQEITWYTENDQIGSLLCLLLMAAAVLSVWIKKQREEDQEKKRKQCLQKQYPDLVSKIQLYTAAGLSLRKCMERLADDQEEIAHCLYEMDSGVTGTDALMHYGERCGTPEYKKLSLLLAQSQQKGGQRLSVQLEQEVQEAFEGRKRNARVEGEKASIKMVLPLGIMLVIVMALIMVPALLSF